MTGKIDIRTLRAECRRAVFLAARLEAGIQTAKERAALRDSLPCARRWIEPLGVATSTTPRHRF